MNRRKFVKLCTYIGIVTQSQTQLLAWWWENERGLYWVDIKDACINCGMCKVVCPTQVFIISNNKIVAAYDEKCIACGRCILVCTENAIEVGELT